MERQTLIVVAMISWEWKYYFNMLTISINSGNIK